MSQLPDSVVLRVRARARYRCEYCQSQERYVGEAFTIGNRSGGVDSPLKDKALQQ